MPQKHPFAVTNFQRYCQKCGMDTKKLKARREHLRRFRALYESFSGSDRFRQRVKLSLWNVERMTWGLLPPSDPNSGRGCICSNCKRDRLPIGRPPKDVGAAKLRAYKQKRQDDNA